MPWRLPLLGQGLTGSITVWPGWQNKRSIHFGIGLSCRGRNASFSFGRCCRCKCLPGCHDCKGAGCSIKIRGTKLVCGKAFSCGCSRTDPEFRRKQALKLPVAVRKARAALAGAKCKGVKRGPSYRLTIDQAASRLGITKDNLMDMGRAGVLRNRYIGGRIKFSAADVTDLIALRSGEAKRCPLDTS